jgi:hypothetical protein
MARTVTEDLDGITVTAVYSTKTRTYLAYTTLTGSTSVAWVKRDPQQPQSSEWEVMWHTGLHTWHPTLRGALSSIGERVREEQS